MHMSNLKQMTLDFYKSVEHDIDHALYLQSALRKLKSFTTALTFFNFIIFHGNIIIFFIYILTQTHLLLLPVFIPFIDHETTLGYLLNISFHITMGLIGFHTFTSYDTSIILYGYHGNIMLKIFVEKFSDLEVILGYDEGQREVQYKIENFIEYIDEYGKYLDEFGRMVRLPFLTAICLNTLGLILCIIVGLNVSIELGVKGSIGLFIGFLLPCITIVLMELQVCLNPRVESKFPYFLFH